MKRLVSFTLWRNRWKRARIETKVVVQTKKLEVERGLRCSDSRTDKICS